MRLQVELALLAARMRALPDRSARVHSFAGQCNRPRGRRDLRGRAAV